MASNLVRIAINRHRPFVPHQHRTVRSDRDPALGDVLPFDMDPVRSAAFYGIPTLTRGVDVPERVHPHDLGTVVDQHGVAIRSGHHCAKPLMHRLGVVATARASFYIYNDRDDVDALIDSLLAARKVFRL